MIERNSQPTVLLLSVYPLQRPLNGGQVRLAEIADQYRRTGWRVHSIAVYDDEAYGPGDVGPDDIPFPASSAYRLHRGRRIPFTSDVFAGRFAAADNGGFPQIRDRIVERIDVIHMEQPWLLPLAQRLLRDSRHCARAATIYGSQNIEAPLKKAMLARAQIEHDDDLMREIEAVEQRAVRECDLALAVTYKDMAVLESMGARKILLAPNGVRPWTATQERLQYWKSRLPAAPWLLYIGSAYAPNLTGFLDCVGDSLACIPEGSQLVVAGAVSAPLQEALSKPHVRDANLSRLTVLSTLSDDDLAAVKTLAHAFLSPITVGGGSNLKMAEALYARKPVICTTTSLRGFEEFAAFPDVIVADTRDEFHAAIARTLAHSVPSAGQAKHAMLYEQLAWKNCLSGVPGAAMRLMKAAPLVA
jgi:glycosyltransferase involved in cell wall biosynthesis